MGGGRGRLGHRPSPTPTQGLWDRVPTAQVAPGSENGDLGPGGRGVGGQDASVGLGWAGLAQRAASCGEQTHTHTHVRTHTPWKHLPRLGPFLPSLLLPEAHQGWGGVRDAQALEEVAASFACPFGQPPCCLVGDHYCFSRDREAARAAARVRKPRGKGFPSLPAGNSG